MVVVELVLGLLFDAVQVIHVLPGIGLISSFDKLMRLFHKISSFDSRFALLSYRKGEVVGGVADLKLRIESLLIVRKAR